MSGSRASALVVGVIVVLFALIQVVPYGREHTNPAPGHAVEWSSPRTLELARRACFDCHSNETRWPWYSSIAPASWRVQSHVNEGRQKLNFTDFIPTNRRMAHAAGEAGEVITKGEMPPNDYLLMHPEARLSAAEKRELTAGLDSTFATFVHERAARRAEREARGERGEREEEGH